MRVSATGDVETSVSPWSSRVQPLPVPGTSFLCVIQSAALSGRAPIFYVSFRAQRTIAKSFSLTFSLCHSEPLRRRIPDLSRRRGDLDFASRLEQLRMLRSHLFAT